ncbi:MAG: cob(I)yrinic acid a,c-diamide adenosyltransferase [Candidatus Magnetomorum sp.]|nr:cob(I)yrinic acid a,c-diamide adenosyltransferase [Candidatus Magnetomorum sp.]
MRIYTRQGDQSTTQLIGGHRVSKNHDQINAYGDVDELNAVIGGIVTHLPDDCSDISEEIHRIQIDLFDIGACLATPETIHSSQRYLPEDRIQSLEKAMDRMSCAVPPLNTFILPAGHISAVFSHMARTVCRRSERKVVGLIEKTNPSDRLDDLDMIQTYLNRLSDYCFVLARYLNHRFNVEETIVKRKK